MKIYDISRELTSAEVYPGDPAPYVERVRTIGSSSSYNLTTFFSCCHSATHVDAPLHLVDGGKTTEEIPLSRFTGKCTVVTAKGILTGKHIDELLPYCQNMILFRGNGQTFLSKSAAFALAEAGITLVGTDAQSIASPDAMQETHFELLNRELIVLEGLDLQEVADGDYLLMAFPLKIRGVEGAPCRAVLIGDNNE